MSSATDPTEPLNDRLVGDEALGVEPAVGVVGDELQRIYVRLQQLLVARNELVIELALPTHV